ncbi:hypothetical protein B9G98_04394 [Wickerhamiella sorbophila]|uniref:Uncharacterized protein n=1 Tax=Wickerhamiella sorbophila TaxID=45607 RepID=A0A2T0FP59_9ASCO|nr:hypothetical protein B9G98_04394 [Wickerhamiella sorbophila]PRT56774.1 hypothetical protein B9G98_04394 [Wickerhamiella sorbophila]
MGSQTTVLQRLRRLLAKRQSEEGTQPTDGSVAVISNSRASSDERSTGSREASPEEPAAPEPAANSSNTSLELRRRVSFGSLSSRDVATSTAATEETSEQRDTTIVSSSPTPAASLNGNAVVRMDPKVYLLRNKHTDAASILTIASSSKRRRRRSLDTNASTRAMAAESMFSSDAGSVTSN